MVRDFGQMFDWFSVCITATGAAPKTAPETNVTGVHSEGVRSIKLRFVKCKLLL